MKFGSVPVEQSVGGFLAHGVRYKTLHLKKGELIRADHVQALKDVGIDAVMVARLETGDIAEDVAALAIAQALIGPNLSMGEPGTGRVNIHADADGIFVANEAMIDRLNDIDEGITLATRKPMHAVAKGEMIATVKIIPFSVPEVALAQAVQAADEIGFALHEFLPLRIGVISTLLPGLKLSVVTKTLDILAARLTITPALIIADRHVSHDTTELAQAMKDIAKTSDMIIVFGASAITDRRDVIPAALLDIGGRITHFGMPVDPGNLLLIGELQDGKPVIGAPGCARSPKESGFDWVLHRLLAGLPVSSADIKRMGAGGLLLEKLPQSHTYLKSA